MAEALTGWTAGDALGQSFAAVFRIVNEYTRKPAEDPVGRVLREGKVVGLASRHPGQEIGGSRADQHHVGCAA